MLVLSTERIFMTPVASGAAGRADVGLIALHLSLLMQ